MDCALLDVYVYFVNLTLDKKFENFKRKQKTLFEGKIMRNGGQVK